MEKISEDFEKWFINQTVFEKGFATYSIKLDLQIVDDPIGFWNNIYINFREIKSIQNLLKYGYILNIYEVWETRTVTIDVITKKSLIDEFILDYKMKMSNVIFLIKTYQFINSPLFIDPKYKSSLNFDVKIDIFNIQEYLEAESEKYMFVKMENKIAILENSS